MFTAVQGAGIVGVDLTLRSSMALAYYAGRCTDPCCGRVRTRRPGILVGWLYPVCYLVNGLLRVVSLGPGELP